MAKKQHLTWLVAAALTAVSSLTSCDENANPWMSQGQGGIRPGVDLNTNVVGAQKKTASRAIQSPTDVTVSDLSLSITSADGSYSHTWTSVDQYDASTKFATGQYKVEAYYSSPKQEGFGKPAFYGSTDVTVRDNETSQAQITATLANAMLTVKYTDEFKKYMTSWDANAHSQGGEYIYYAADETRPAYFNPGEITLNVSVEKPNGKGASFQVAKFNGEARHHYTVTVGLNQGGEGSGDAVLVISFDDTLAQEDIYINIADEILDAPAPTVTGAGTLTDGARLTHVFGDEWTAPVKENIIAKGGIGSVTLTTRSESLISQGWPAEIDLCNVPEATRSIMRQLGFNPIGLWNTENPTMAVLDFTDVINHITEATNNANVFTVNVVDKMTKVSDPFSFEVSITPMELALSNAARLEVGATELAFDLSYNGSNPQSTVSFQASNDRGTWDKLTTKSITATDAADVYRCVVTVPANAKPVTLRAVTNVKNSESLKVDRVSPAFSCTVPEQSIWARKASVVLTANGIDSDVLANLTTVYLSTDGTNFSKVSATAQGNSFLLSGLTPATKYTLRVSLTDDVNNSCAPVEFTTETAAGVPNGDFENLVETISESGIEQGGKWSISAGINYQTTSAYSIKEPTGWASVNKKTNSSSTRNTWFAIPSTYNTTLSWITTIPRIHVVNTGWDPATPAVYDGLTAQSGSNAMVIRNVGWAESGSVPGIWRKEFAGKKEYYNHNAPDVSNTSAGKLFLGSYSYSSGNETYNEGTAFASRPASLHGYYKYVCDSHDTAEKGTVTVQILNGNTVIGSGSASLSAAGNFTAFEVPLTYVKDTPKATQLRIMFSSSDKTRESDIYLTTYCELWESCKRGATLTVDNLTFTY